MERNSGKIWKVNNPDRERVENITREFGLSRLTARLLVNRDIFDSNQVRKFLKSDLSTLSDPMEMADSARAAGRIIEACKNDEKIFLYADYDVDGATGAACLFLFMKEVFPDLHISIHQNDRIKDGYGVKFEHLESAYLTGHTLAVTVDSGITDLEEIGKANELGLDVIVTDHHTVGDIIPPALAVMNPRRKDCPFPFKELSGVGVVFALVCVMRKLLREEGYFGEREEPQLLKYLDLVALGTVADLAPLRGDNRVLVKYGIEQIRRNPRPGIEALVNIAGIKKEYLNEVDLGYRIGPRLNAAGRIGDSILSSTILVTDSISRANDFARILSRNNVKRQMEEEKIFRSADKIIKEERLDRNPVIVLGRENWHTGVVGIVASKIQEKYLRPAIVFSFDGEEGRGSGRSRKPIDLHALLISCSRHIERFGGHPQAVGLRVRKDKFDSFAKALQDAAADHLGDEPLSSAIDVDGEVSLNDISEKFMDELDTLGPFGIGNPEPLLFSRNLKIFGVSSGNRSAVRFNVSQGGSNCEALLFKKRDLKLGDLGRIDLLYTPKISSFRGRKTLKLFVRDLKAH